MKITKYTHVLYSQGKIVKMGLLFPRSCFFLLIIPQRGEILKAALIGRGSLLL